MNVILTENVRNLGNVGEIVNVSAGFARNFLIPRKCAVIADSSNKNFLDQQQKMLQKKIAEKKKEALDLKKELDSVKLQIIKKVAGNGKLFGSVTPTEIKEELLKQGKEVEKRHIQLEAPIKKLGSFKVPLKLFTDVESSIELTVIMDPAQVEEEKKRQEKLKKAKEAAKAQKEAAEKENANKDSSEGEDKEDQQS